MTDETLKCIAPCLACGRELENNDPEGNQPARANEFMTYGHYGSTVFDPLDGTRLAINVCDECLSRARRERRVLFMPRQARGAEVVYETWESDDDDREKSN